MSKDYLQVKRELHSTLTEIVNQRIAIAQEALQLAGEARNNETKSSAGDKHETGRAMMQIEENNIRTQLAQTLQLKNTLAQLNSRKSFNEISLGSVAITSQGNYFLAVGIGKVLLDNEPWYCISPGSPIGKVLLLKTKGDTVSFQGKNITITEVY